MNDERPPVIFHTIPPARERDLGREVPPAPEGEFGLVLSRIADPARKELAARLIAEAKGCGLEEARRLADRTIVPVLKGVTREVADLHLEKFRRANVSARVTTKQRG